MESIIDNSDRLHFFEHVQVDMLQEYLRTGISYFINAILNAHPSLVNLRYYTLQISTLVDFMKDFYYLLKHKCNYAQKFFNLQRKIPINSKIIALKGAFIFAIIPYLCTKIDNLYNEIIADHLDGKSINTFKKLIKALYPYLYAIIGVVQVIFKFRYLFIQEQHQLFYNLFYKINGINLGHKKKQEPDSKYPIMDLVKKPGLLIILMGHKIINWYYTQKSQKKMIKVQNGQRQKVKAPLRQSDLKQQGKCPICTKNITNPTMVRTTGYVYCFNCISDYVKKMGRCPMSQLPITENALQIIYN